MFELVMVLLAVCGAFWLFGALIAGVFKLTFGIIGAIFGGLVGLFALGITALLVLPFVLLAMLPALLPLLCVAALVWVIVHASRAHPESSAAREQARPG